MFQLFMHFKGKYLGNLMSFPLMAQADRVHVVVRKSHPIVLMVCRISQRMATSSIFQRLDVEQDLFPAKI